MNLIALDLDGTLEDSRVDMVASVQRMRAQFGLVQRPDADFVDHVNRGMGHLYTVCFAELWADGQPDPTLLKRVEEEYCTDYLVHIADTTKPYAGIEQALQDLKSIASLAVVTNKPEALSIALLETLGLVGFFETIIGGDTCFEAKPSAVPLAEAARRCQADRVVMVGDSGGDIRCARDFGCPVIWCQWGYNREPGPSLPDAVAHHPSELASLARSLGITPSSAV